MRPTTTTGNKAAVAIEGIAFLAAVWVEGVVAVTAIGCIRSTVPLPVGIGVFRAVAAVGVMPLLPGLIPVGVVLNQNAGAFAVVGKALITAVRPNDDSAAGTVGPVLRIASAAVGVLPRFVR